MNKYETENLIRINKSVARKIYNLGLDIVLCPCKVNPKSPWWLITRVNNQTYPYTFDELCSKFIYYNCDSELGKYPAYYVDKYTYIQFTFEDGSNPYYYRGSAVDCLNELNRWSNNWMIEGGKSHCFELKRKRPIV